MAAMSNQPKQTHRPGPDSALTKATRRSIKQNFPLGAVMSTGCNNPITLHTVDDELFARMWSFIGETMVVPGELSRTTKEAIATLVSERNACPDCIKAHSLLGFAAAKSNKRNRSNEKVHSEALAYAELLMYQVQTQRSWEEENIASLDTKCWTHLTPNAKAEVALVCALFLHVNRVVSVIMGEEMSTAMLRVPRFAAKVMEKDSAIQMMSHCMAPLLAKTFRATPDQGFTQSLFSEEDHPSKLRLPNGLQNLQLAGPERAQAVARLVQWVAHYESDLLLDGQILDYDFIAFIDQVTRTCDQESILLCTRDPIDQDPQDDEEITPAQVLAWVETKVRHDMPQELCCETTPSRELCETTQSRALCLKDAEPVREVEEWTLALATVLIVLTLAPKAVYHSPPWKTLVAHLGDQKTRSIVVFWSLRITLREAPILFDSVDGEGEKNIVQQAPKAA